MTSIGQWIEELVASICGAIYTPLDRMFTWLNDSFRQELANGLILLMETLEPEAYGQAKDVFAMALNNPALSADQKAILQKLSAPSHPVQVVPLMLAIVPVLWGVLSNISAGPNEMVARSSRGLVNSYQWSLDDSVIADWRGIKLRQELLDIPFSHGMTKDQYEQYRALRRFVPPTNDIIRFIVRDAFTPAVVEKYQYDTGFDGFIGQARPYLQAQGVDDEVARLYWRAHWELPSLTLAYEMRHRDLITEDDLRLLLRTNDMAPTFIEPIIKATYNPLTRVDIRRMYAAGVLTEADLLRAYKDIGYNSQNAQRLVEFTKASVQGKEKSLSRTMIEQAYTSGQMSLDDCVKMLKAEGYSEKDANLIMGLVDFKARTAWTKEQIKALHGEAMKGLITQQEYQTALEALNLPAKRVSWLMDQLAVDRRKNAALPGIDALAGFWKAGLISDREANKRILALGYDSETAGLYLALWKGQKGA